MLEITKLFFSYDKKSPFLLNDINLKLKKGEYLSIIGDNGSGKSTLLKLILKFLLPVKGNIKINSQNIGYVPQKQDDFNSQFPMTVYELLNCHRKVLKLKDKSLITKNLELVKMQNYKNALIGTLSGGQRQKILIARALLGSPELIIFDEPSTGIDVKSQQEIYSLIKKLNIENKITILSVEHNVEATLNNSSVIYQIVNGSGTLYLPKDFTSILERSDFHVAL